VILALADIHEPTSSSQPALIAKWHKECLGTTMAERTLNIEKKKDLWSDILTRAFKAMSDLEQLNVFHNAEGALDLTEGRRKTELPFVLGRIVRTFARIEDFRSMKTHIAIRLRSQLFGKTQLDLLHEFEVSCRDGTFQKKLLKKIDAIIVPAGDGVQPRPFTPKQKKEKLAEQGGLCALCGEKIMKHQVADGDHVIAWSEGGETTMENLQILHRHCHQEKTKGQSV
jgi:5-methylcytosine-specific restriction endonuclease McrA